MIPQKHSGGVEVDGLTGERAQFTIAANGKAFRTLIDGLYSNKIQAVVRELWSNAADSHVAAGYPDVPFLCDLPTNMDPVFRVRDMGTGLSHDGVMRLYTTIFESTKEGSNDETGMLGLGSKSPFAYTDTFSVVAYDGLGSKRIYVANIGSNGVPAITHVSTVEGLDRDENPRGLEVSFPVQRTDLTTFRKEAQWASMAYDVKPIISGAEIKLPTPRMSGKNWAIYASGAFGDSMPHRNLIRQGSAVYPNSTVAVPGLGQTWIALITVPIGTCDVTASREALSFTPDTRTRVERIVQSVGAEIKAQCEAEVAKAKTRVEKARAYMEFNGVLPNLRGSTEVSLLAYPERVHSVQFPMERCPGDVVKVGPEFGKNGNRGRYMKETSSESVQLLPQVRLFVDNGEKMIRKIKRVRAALTRRLDLIVEAEGADWVIKCWELTPSQVFSLQAIHDPGPSPREVSVREKKILKPGQYWMIRKSGNTTTCYGYGSQREHGQGWPNAMHSAWKHLDPSGPLRKVLPDTGIVYVTPLQQEKMNLPDSKRYDLAVEAQLKSEAQALPISDALAVTEIGQHLSGVSFLIVMDQFYPDIKITREQASKIIEKARYAKIELQKFPITASVRAEIQELNSIYPLLFGKTDRSVFETYIQQVQAANARVAEEVPA